MITGTENLLQIAQMDKAFLALFENHGLGKYFKPENLEKIGRFTRLKTLLEANHLDAESFIASLNKLHHQASEAKVQDITHPENLHFSAMLPCGLRNPFKEFVDSYLRDNLSDFESLNYLIEGNVNHELSYYPLLDHIKNANELPDIIMASDVNNFFHRPFMERFIHAGVFETFQPGGLNPYLEKAGYADPEKHFTMYTANMLVIVVDKEKLGDRKMPVKWVDLLSPEFENDIIMRGEDDFFCNAIMLPFYKDYGMEAIRRLAKNIKKGLHPAEMVKLAGKDSDEGAAVYLMPWFFSKRINNQKAEVIWPVDGAIASPVFLLVKKDKIEQHRKILDFLFSKATGELLTGRFFPATRPEVANDHFPPAVKWLGWDFLNRTDIGKLKEEMRIEFMKIWDPNHNLKSI